MIQSFSNRDQRLRFADTATPMLGADCHPRAALFVKDRLQLNREGYKLWTRILRPAEYNINYFDIHLLADRDRDGDVDLADLAGLLTAYGMCAGDPGYSPQADFDDSGCLDLADLAALLGNYDTMP